MKKTLSQIVHDLFEDGFTALAMSYAIQRGDYETYRSLEDKIH